MNKEIDAIQESVKLALDAAEAAADVTAEYNKVKTENMKLISGVSGVYKHARTLAIVAGVSVGSALVLALAMHFRSVSSLETLSKTSREALVVFAENVDDMTSSIKSLQEALKKQDELLAVNRRLTEEIMELRAAAGKPYEALNGAMSDSFTAMRADNKKLGEDISKQLQVVNDNLSKAQSDATSKIIKSTSTLQAANEKGASTTVNLNKTIATISDMQKRTLEHLQLLVEENSRLMRALEEGSRQIKYP
jgi:hypothetical protein